MSDRIANFETLDVRSFLLVALVFCLAAGLLVAPATVVAQEDDGNIPPVPASYYGDVTIDGDAAPAGVEVTADLEGETYGPMETDADGEFGGPTAADAKLVVDPDEEPDDTTVTFYVDGEEADETATWEAGSNEEIFLTVGESQDENDEEDETDDGSSGGSGGNGGSGGGSGSASTGGGGGGGGVGPSVSVSSPIADDAPDSPGSTVSFDRSPVESVTLSNDDAEGTIEVEDYDDLPPGAPDTGDRPVLESVVIEVSDAHANEQATFHVTVDQTDLLREDVEPEDLAVMKEEDDGYQTLETTVVDDHADPTLEATTPGFSTFIVSTDEGDIGIDDTDDETPTDPDPETPEDAQPAEDEESTDDVEADDSVDDMPGFGAPVVLAALLVASLIALRRH